MCYLPLKTLNIILLLCYNHVLYINISGQTEPTPPDKTSLHLNVAYTMPKNQVEMKVNDAYAVPPYPANVSTEVHHYDIVLQPVYATIGPRQMKYRESQSA